LGTLAANGSWRELTRVEDECFPSQVLRDADAIYFTTRNSLWRYDRARRDAAMLYHTDSNVLSMAENNVALAADSVALFVPVPSGDEPIPAAFELAKLPKQGGTLVPLARFDSKTTPMITGMVADEASVYLLSQLDLKRISLATGTIDVLAKRGVPGGFAYPVLGASKVYFVDMGEAADKAVTATVRSVGK
jgi:hypothetical protein